MKRKIVTDITSLKMPCRVVEVEDKELVTQIVGDLKDTFAPLRSRGCGLAANQIGYSLKVALLRLRSGEEILMVNPKIEDGFNPIKFNEGCFSFSGITTITKRFSRVVLSYTDFNTGEVAVKELKGMDAIAAQHEVDHLMGRTMFDRKWRAK